MLTARSKKQSVVIIETLTRALRPPEQWQEVRAAVSLRAIACEGFATTRTFKIAPEWNRFKFIHLSRNSSTVLAVQHILHLVNIRLEIRC